MQTDADMLIGMHNVAVILTREQGSNKGCMCMFTGLKAVAVHSAEAKAAFCSVGGYHLLLPVIVLIA